MPNAFDIGQYTANNSPDKAGTFVNIGDVMNSFGDVFGEIIQLLPQLVQLIEQVPEDIVQLLETGLQAFLNLIFPTDGSESPLITALTGILGSVTGSGGSGGILQQLVDMVIQIIPQLISTLTSMIGTTGGNGLIQQIIGMFISLLPDLLSSMTGLLGTSGGSGITSGLLGLVTPLLTGAGGLLSGFTGGSNILTQLIGAVGGSGSTLGDFANLFGGLGSLQTLLSGFTGGSPILSQLVGAGGGNTSAPNLLTEFASIFSGGGSGLPAVFVSGLDTGVSLLSQLPSLLTLPLSSLGGGILPSGISLGSLAQIPGLSGLLSGLDASGSTSLLSQLPSLLTLPLSAVTGLVGAGGLLSGFTTGSSILTQLLGVFGGSATGGLSGLGGLSSVFTDLFGLLGGVTGLGSGTPSLTSGTAFGIPLLSSLLDPSSGSIFPSLLNIPNLLSQLSIGNMSTTPTNMLKYPMFDNATEIAGEGIWSYDSTTTVPSPPGWTLPDKPGAVSVTANGVANTLYSNIVPVVPGDSIYEAISAVWSGLSSTGSPIQLLAKVYDSSQNVIDTPVFASVASPGASGSQILSNSAPYYTVPSGGAWMTFALRVLGTATAGTVKFGKGLWYKNNQIPGGSVTGLGGSGTNIISDMESLLTGGISTLGGSSSGLSGSALISMFTSLLSAIPGTNVLGLGGGSSNILTDLESLVTGGITSLGGSTTGVPGSGLISMFTGLLSAIPGTNVLGLGGSGTNIVSDVESLLTQGISTLGGSTSGVSGSGLISLFTGLLSAIPNTNVGGILGPNNIGGTAQTTVDKMLTGLTGLPVVGGSLENLQSQMGQLVGSTQSAVSISQDVSTTITQQAVTKPLHVVIDPTMDVTVPLNDCVSGSTFTTVSVTAANSVIGMVSTSNGGVKEAIAWYSTSATTNITGFYLTLYQVNTATGVGTELYQSPNIVGAVTTGGWNYYNLPVANYLQAQPGYVYAVELAVTGTGTYTLAGMPNHPIAANPNVLPKQIGATRSTSGGVTAPATINPFVASANVPFFGLSGSEGQSQVAPVTQEFLASGTFNIPTWAQVAGTKFDVIVVGAGSSAESGGSGFASGSGAGGWAGTFYGVTLTYGVDIPLGTTQFTVNIGVGGARVTGSFSNGLPGGATTVVIPTYGTITGPGGPQVTSSSYWSSTASGQGAGTFEFPVGSGRTYPGGAEQTATSTPGIQPGGGGSGGLNAAGAAGANGGAWIRVYQPGQ